MNKDKITPEEIIEAFDNLPKNPQYQIRVSMEDYEYAKEKGWIKEN